MESTGEKVAPESGKPVSLPPPEVPPPPPPAADCFAVDVGLRIFLFASTLVSVVVMVTAKQTETVPVPGLPFPVPVKAKFSNSPAFVYFIAALSVACLYSIITLLASFCVIFKPVFPKALLAHFAIIDVLMLGLVASATGAGGAVGYIGLRGNSHSNWTKVCNVYDTYCHHIAGALFVSLFAAVLLVFLIILSIYSLSRRVRA